MIKINGTIVSGDEGKETNFQSIPIMQLPNEPLKRVQYCYTIRDIPN